MMAYRDVMTQFVTAKTWADYQRAKRAASRLRVTEQLSLVDAIVEARLRLEGGVQ